MSAFFAIAIDSFPVNDNGKLPLSYVLKYMRKWTRLFFLQDGSRVSGFANLLGSNYLSRPLNSLHSRGI
jgi:hypothetical protein